MRRALSTLAALSIGAGALADEKPQQACGGLVDVPELRVDFASGGTGPFYRREHDLVRSFSEGDGELDTHETESPTLVPGLALYPLPWHVEGPREARFRLLTWNDREQSNDESMPAIVLRANERYCTSPLSWSAGARLRLEPFRLERTGSLRLTSGDGALFDDELGRPRSLSSETALDIALDGTGGSLCLEAREGAVAIGEPRVVSPESPSEDPRPRWVVLTIIDALRGDLVRSESGERIVPALHALREDGHDYRRAVAPGCHTRASVWPILMGRDLMRIDPLKRRQSMPIQSPLQSVYSRANVFITHFAQAAGYQPVFLGNNAYLNVIPAFARYSSWGRTDTGTADTVAALPALMERYADERAFLVYYVSTPHGQSQTPNRLFEELGCNELEGIEQCRCSYNARARHADEALAALQDGLRSYGLNDETFQIVTADHGELFEEGVEREGELPAFATGTRGGTYQRFDLAHGNACHVLESDVPLVAHGKGVDEPAHWEDAVSGLDIMPTLLDVLELDPVSRLDGELLPLHRPRPRRPKRSPLVSYGFCSDSVIEGGEQLLWWSQGCRLRELEGGAAVRARAELWVEGEPVTDDERHPERVGALLKRHELWLEERLPSDALVFDTANLDGRRITLTVDGGRITDFGPASSVFGLDSVHVDAGEPNQLTVTFDGYRGLFYVTTLPARAPVSIVPDGEGEVLAFVGPAQLPLPDTGRFIDPATRPSFFVADGVPDRRHTEHPSLRLWWQRYGSNTEGENARALSEFDRVLREWGYIR